MGTCEETQEMELPSSGVFHLLWWGTWSSQCLENERGSRSPRLLETSIIMAWGFGDNEENACKSAHI